MGLPGQTLPAENNQKARKKQLEFDKIMLINVLFAMWMHHSSSLRCSLVSAVGTEGVRCRQRWLSLVPCSRGRST